jgi:hypothetical protein
MLQIQITSDFGLATWLLVMASVSLNWGVHLLALCQSVWARVAVALVFAGVLLAGFYWTLTTRLVFVGAAALVVLFTFTLAVWFLHNRNCGHKGVSPNY